MRKYSFVILGAAVTLVAGALFAGSFWFQSGPEQTADLTPTVNSAASDVTRHSPVSGDAAADSGKAPLPTKTPRDKDDPSVDSLVVPTPQPVPVPVPQPSSVGVRPGAKLQVHKGDIVVTEAGTTLKNLEVHGSISVRAPNVTIKNTRIIGQKPVETGLVSSRSTGLRIVDSEIWSAHRNPDTNGVMGSEFSLERVEIRNVIDQVHIHGTGNVTIRDSWLHSNVHFEKDPNWKGGPSHDDNIQITSGHNIKIIDSQLTGAHNAAIMVTRGSGSVSNLQIIGNRIGGGGCSINIAPGSGAPIDKLRIANNVFHETQRVSNCAVIAPREYSSALADNRWARGSTVRLSNAG